MSSAEEKREQMPHPTPHFYRVPSLARFLFVATESAPNLGVTLASQYTIVGLMCDFQCVFGHYQQHYFYRNQNYTTMGFSGFSLVF